VTKIATRQVSQMQYSFADRMGDTRSIGINVAFIELDLCFRKLLS
jgi:hypothetical protein